jgi:hypothetical protein
MTENFVLSTVWVEENVLPINSVEILLNLTCQSITKMNTKTHKFNMDLPPLTTFFKQFLQSFKLSHKIPGQLFFLM